MASSMWPSLLMGGQEDVRTRPANAFQGVLTAEQRGVNMVAEVGDEPLGPPRGQPSRVAAIRSTHSWSCTVAASGASSPLARSVAMAWSPSTMARSKDCRAGQRCGGCGELPSGCLRFAEAAAEPVM